jgi:hypothetical protein
MMIRQGSLLGLLGCLLLAGCAAPSGRIAPVESRSINAPVPTVPTPTPVATPSDPAVTVTVLPAPEPASGTPRPLPSGASSATPTPPPAPAGTGATAPPPPPPQQLALATPVTKTDAVDGILREVRRHWAAGQHEQAAAGLERALRIEPSNAYLWQHLAAVRLDQGKSQQAEQFAAKSNSVAGDSAPLRLRNWRIIAEARRLGGDIAGAREAEARASTYGTGR